MTGPGLWAQRQLEVDGSVVAQGMHQQAERVATLLVAGSNHTGQDILDVCAAGVPISTPRHLASDDGRADRLLGWPVRRLHFGMIEERKQVRSLVSKVAGKPGIRRVRRLPLQKPVHSGLDSATRHRKPLPGDHGLTIAKGQRGLQDPLHGHRKAGGSPLRNVEDIPNPCQMVSQAALMLCVHESAIRRPAISAHDSRELDPEDFLDDIASSAGDDPIDGEASRDEVPQPPTPPTYLPSGLVGIDNGARLERLNQGRVGWLELAAQTLRRSAETRTRRLETKRSADERGDLAPRQPVAFVEQSPKRQRVGAQLHSRRAQRIGCLEAMSRLNSLSAGAASTDVNLEPTTNGLHRREFALELFRDPDFLYRAATRGANLRQGNVHVLINASGRGTKRSLTVQLAGLTAGWQRIGFGFALGERRCLALPASDKLLNTLFQASQFLLEAGDATAKRRVLSKQLIVGRLAWRSLVCHSLFIGHTHPTLYSNPVNNYSATWMEPRGNDPKVCPRS